MFGDEIDARQRVADRYAAGLGDVVTVPSTPEGATLHLGAVHAAGRATATALVAALKADGVPTAVYYPRPLHQQTAYRGYPGRRRRRRGVRAARRHGAEPADAPLPRSESDQDAVIDAVSRAVAAAR